MYVWLGDESVERELPVTVGTHADHLFESSGALPDVALTSVAVHKGAGTARCEMENDCASHIGSVSVC